MDEDEKQYFNNNDENMTLDEHDYDENRHEFAEEEDFEAMTVRSGNTKHLKNSRYRSSIPIEDD